MEGMKIKLMYTKSGYIEVGRFIEEEVTTPSMSEARRIINKCFDVIVTATKGWGFTIQVISEDGQFWSIERNLEDKNNHVYTCIYAERWNSMDVPRKMKRSEIIKDIMERGFKK